MLCILFMFVLLLFMYFYYDYDRDVLEPTLLLTGSFAFSIFLVAIYEIRWNLIVHNNTIFVILLSLLFFHGGSFLTHSIIKEKKEYKKYENISFVNRNNVIACLLMILSLSFLYLNIRDFYNLAEMLSDSSTISKQLRVVLDNLNNNKVTYSHLHTYRLYFLECLSITNSFYFLYNCIFHKIKIKNFFYLCPTFIYFVSLFYQGGRQMYLHYLLFMLILGFLMYQYKNHLEGHFNKKMIVSLLAIFLLFLLLFIGIGIFNEKIQGHNFIKVFVHYDGVNITALDYFINKRIIPDDQYIGTMTLSPIYSNLRSLGFSLPILNAYITEFVPFGEVDTNCFTALRRYIQDYGYSGCMMIMFIVGALFTFIYDYIKYIAFKFLPVMIYSMFSYVLFLSAREEMFFNWMFSTASIYRIILVYGLFKMQFKNNDLNKNLL